MASDPKAESLTDEALFARYVDGDASAFDALFARYAPIVGRLVRRRVRHAADATDLVQQTFFQLHRARRDFRRDGRLRPWLLTIAMNVVRQYYRKRGRATLVPLEPDNRFAPTTQAHDPVEAERVRTLYQALARLPEGQRSAIELHWLEGLPFAEVAEILGIKLSAVKVRAHRGYQRLRRLIEDIERRGPRHEK